VAAEPTASLILGEEAEASECLKGGIDASSDLPTLLISPGLSLPIQPLRHPPVVPLVAPGRQGRLARCPEVAMGQLGPKRAFEATARVPG
jgi:hypothetical protein